MGVIASPTPSARAAHVGLNAQLLSLTETYRGAGINGYIHHLLQGLPAAAPDLRFTAFLGEHGYVAPPGLSVHAVSWPTSKPLARIAWEQAVLPPLLRAHAVDLVHGMAYAVPQVPACRAVVTVHDLSFFCFPETLPPLRRVYLRAATRSATRRAERVIADSEQTKRDLVRLLGVPANKIDVVYNGVDEAYTPAGHQEIEEFRERRGLPDRFILFLGTLEPRKNIVSLLEAFALWRERRAQGPASGVKLVVAGGKGWYFEHIFARAEELDLGDDVWFPGFVPADELPWWYRAAECFVFPSVYEGFGVPVLEAMACGTPVITSSVSSLPEVAGDAAITVPPEETDALVDALDRVMTDEQLGARMREAGLRHAARFSWEQAAAETAEVYRRALRLEGGR